MAAASAWDVINVWPGTYKEAVVIGMPLSLIGSGANSTIIDAIGLPNGIFVDGFDNVGLAHVIVSGFNVKNANYEGVLVVSASDVTIRNNNINNNDKTPSKFTGAPEGCPGQPAFELDETGDCGGGLHLIGVSESIVSDNIITLNDDGILISDESAASHDIVVTRNKVVNNPGECGIVIASHPPVGAIGSKHHGNHHITVSENDVENNGVMVGGAGVGLFSDGNGEGRASQNVVIHNRLIGNGLGGVALHSHVGPHFGLPADNMDGNQIIGNYIAKNLADLDDTATGGKVGININSGGGGTPVRGTLITGNTITDEDIDVAVNTPALVKIHQNNLLGGKEGVANVCSLDPPAPCKGGAVATENFWGCSSGPGAKGCSTANDATIVTTPWLRRPVGDDDQDQKERDN
ncbi:right-handed parallel beta-helix repeat-containing protein [Occallatibacter savannae]|uniref:right-handed parallel beta-helix repeat-containing protein n=1 Tax=Occallatibacter savannae TaxID=1002691 RepID=UPI0013A53FDB|nr:right-handed parallel beta-helix repeat-containing protein [Occallatibacter savannae]